jgi:hypothetical protein
MPETNYKESSVAGTRWTRAFRIQIDNMFQVTPQILFVEEEAVQIGDQVITTICGNLSAAYDPANPLDLAIYEALNAKYVALREARDAAV